VALADAGILRLRPVMITVAATVIALFPLAAHGGPLWEPLCYAQIGGLTIATFVTLGLVPVLYSFVVLDLKLIRWKDEEDTSAGGGEAGASIPGTHPPDPLIIGSAHTLSLDYASCDANTGVGQPD
ncbi:MAG: efflux RND transporter permease subunit, partial [Bryobacteraceae bacterium]